MAEKKAKTGANKPPKINPSKLGNGSPGPDNPKTYPDKTPPEKH